MPQMLLDNLIQVFRPHKPIPDLFRIHDDGRPMLALLQTAGLVHPQHTGKLGRLDLVLEQPMKLSLAVRTAGRPCPIRLTLIGANKDMSIEFWQCGAPWEAGAS